jgi:hypothetical protein
MGPSVKATSKAKRHDQGTAPPAVRDRIKEIRTVSAKDLKPNPKNWRQHPASQRDALKGALTEIGNATVPLAYETEEGLVLIDGHLRTSLLGEDKIRVAVLDVTEAEATKLLATLDPIGALAEANASILDEVLREVETGDAALQTLLADLAKDAGLYPDATGEEEEDTGDHGEGAAGPQPIISYTIVFDDTSQQQRWFDRLRKLKAEYPDMETIAERLDAWVTGSNG